MPKTKPMLYLTWDKTGMHLWLGGKPRKARDDGIYQSDDAVRLRMPVTWFGGLVEESQCREFDPDTVFSGFETANT